jgi:hypothetical protein
VGQSGDTIVIDEPFYAYYLKVTGIEHPGADEVISTGETDWRKVVAHLTGPIANGKRIFFQKTDDTPSVARNRSRNGSQQ